MQVRGCVGGAGGARSPHARPAGARQRGRLVGVLPGGQEGGRGGGAGGGAVRRLQPGHPVQVRRLPSNALGQRAQDQIVDGAS